MLVQGELDRRQQAARNADPLRKGEEELRREQARLEKCSDRLISAYQEGLVTLPELRDRMPELSRQARAVESELQPLEMAALNQAKYLQLSARRFRLGNPATGWRACRTAIMARRGNCRATGTHVD